MRPSVEAREDRAHVLELVDVVRSLAAHDRDGILVAEVVAALDGVERVRLGAVLGRVAERRVDAALGRARVRTRRMQLRDHGDVGTGTARLDRGPHSGETRSDHHNVVPEHVLRPPLESFETGREPTRDANLARHRFVACSEHSQTPLGPRRERGPCLVRLRDGERHPDRQRARRHPCDHAAGALPLPGALRPVRRARRDPGRAGRPRDRRARGRGARTPGPRPTGITGIDVAAEFLLVMPLAQAAVAYAVVEQLAGRTPALADDAARGAAALERARRHRDPVGRSPSSSA